MRLIAALVIGVSLVAGSAHAAPIRADFSGNLSPGGANVKAPFNSVITQGGPVSGHFVFDDTQIPAAGSGFVNVFFSSQPSIATIEPEDAFSLDLGGGLLFDLGDALPGAAAVQYNNGAFNGFFFVSDFQFLGNPYRLRMEGGAFNIKALVNGFPGTTNFVNGRLNVGNANLANLGPYTPGGQPTSPVPEPGSLLLVGSGAAALLAKIRRRRADTSTSFRDLTSLAGEKTCR